MAIIEPTQDELQAMENMADVVAWSGLQGDWTYRYSMAGTFFYSLGGAQASAMTIAEFGSIRAEDPEAAITVEEWLYSRFDENPGQTDQSMEATIKPKAFHTNMARKAHRAAGIWAGLVKPMVKVEAENLASLRSAEK